MTIHYGVATDYDYNASHKRDRITVWSGGFMSNREAVGYSLPRGDGYMLNLEYGGSIRVSCPTPRNDENYVAIDAAVNTAMNAR